MKKKYRILLIIFVIVVGLDQWTKSLVLDHLPLYHFIGVIPGFFNLTHVRNTGGAFGIFGGERGGVGSILFVVISFIAVGSILYLFAKVREDEKSLVVAFPLVLGGAIGNLIDRLRLGEVVDFLDFHLYSFHWPAFNIADSAICVGIGLIAWDLLTRDRREAKRGLKAED